MSYAEFIELELLSLFAMFFLPFAIYQTVNSFYDYRRWRDRSQVNCKMPLKNHPYR